MGGAWERMIRLVRQILASLVIGKNLDDDSLHTLLLEVESIINSRSLTACSGNPECSLPPTPNHLLRVDPSIGLPPTLSAISDVYARERYRAVQYIADEFRRRWVEEHPRTLFSRRKWKERRGNISVGDLVLLVDTFSPRDQWPIGSVVKSYPDALGNIRIVDVKTASGVLRRPISKLCIIVNACDKDSKREVLLVEDKD